MNGEPAFFTGRDSTLDSLVPVIWLLRGVGGVLFVLGFTIFASDLRLRYRRNRRDFPEMPRVGAINNQPTTWRFWIGMVLMLGGAMLATG